MKKLIAWILILFLAFGSIFAVPVFASAQGIELVPQGSSHLYPGEMIDIKIKFNDLNKKLTGIKTVLEFDSSKLALEDFTFGSTFANWMSAIDGYTVEGNKITIEKFSVSEVTVNNEDLATLTFKAIAPGKDITIGFIDYLRTPNGVILTNNSNPNGIPQTDYHIANPLKININSRETNGGQGGGSGSGPGIKPPPLKSVISDIVKTADDQALAKALSQGGAANLTFNNTNTSVRLSPAVINKLGENNKPLTIQNNDVTVQFANNSLLTPSLNSFINASDAQLVLGAQTLTQTAKAELLAGAQLGQSTGIYEIGGKIIELSAQITRGNTTERIAGFAEPVAVTIDLADVKLTPEEIAQLTAVRLVKDEQGNIKQVKLGGVYDPQAKTFTFYTDRFSYYTVMRADKLAKVSLGINNPATTVNGVTRLLDVPPTIINNRTMVPLRFVGEALGAEVKWVEETRTVLIKLDGQELILVIDQTGPGLDTPPVILNGRTLVPIRYISESLGANVIWFNTNKTVQIVK